MVGKPNGAAARSEVKVAAKEKLPPSDEDLRVMLFQTVRELLFNVVKHAKAKTATMLITRNNGSMCLTISDDGVGFSPASLATGSGGFGLFNVRERIKYMGGDVEVDSEPGRGCRISITLPLSPVRV